MLLLLINCAGFTERLVLISGIFMSAHLQQTHSYIRAYTVRLAAHGWAVTVSQLGFFPYTDVARSVRALMPACVCDNNKAHNVNCKQGRAHFVVPYAFHVYHIYCLYFCFFGFFYCFYSVSSKNFALVAAYKFITILNRFTKTKKGKYNRNIHMPHTTSHFFFINFFN